MKYATAAAALALLITGCQPDGPDQPAEHRGAVGLAHIHGLAINPADRKLYAGTHHGVFRIHGKGAPEQIAGRTQDFMGFTITGPDHFLASGHPGPDDTDQPPHLGLLESTDAGRTWRARSLSGEVDFHALEAKHGKVYGYDSQTGQVMVSADKQHWDRRAQLPIADLAVSPRDPDELLATTQQGPALSTDGGHSFTPIDGAPLLVLIDWTHPKHVVGVAPDGQMQTSADGGRSWTAVGTVPGRPAALTTHGEAEVYLATDAGVHRSTDGGRTFTLFQALE